MRKKIIIANWKMNKTVSESIRAVTELKNRVLDLLSYPKEFSKKQNIETVYSRIVNEFLLYF